MNDAQLLEFLQRGAAVQGAVDQGKCPHCGTHNTAASVVIRCLTCGRSFPRGSARPSQDTEEHL